MKFRNVIKAALGVTAVLLLSSSCVVRLNKKAIMAEMQHRNAERITASKVIAEKDTTVQAFGKLSLSCGFDVYFTQTESAPTIKITGSDNLIPYVDIAGDGDILRIGFKNLAVINGCDVKIYISAPFFNELEQSGSVDFFSDNICNPEEHFSIRTAGSSDIHIKSLISKEFSLSASGSTDIEVESLLTGNASLSIAGSGDFEGYLSGKKLDVSIAGSGNIDLNVDVEEIDGRIAGSGDFTIAGKAARSARYSIAGSGSVNAKDLTSPNTQADVKGSGSIKYRDSDGDVKSK